MMSLAQFDEVYEICCGMLEEEEVLLTPKKPKMEAIELMRDCIPESNRWWEAAVKEILKEKESEMFYV